MLTRLLVIRHAEHHEQSGFDEDNQADPQSLTARGWQRAGALVRLFCPDIRSGITPDSIHTSMVSESGPSKRPRQTVAPLHAFLAGHGGVRYAARFEKHQAAQVAEAAVAGSGTALIAWEHSIIPEIVAALPDPPSAPSEWPADRYDLIWVFDRNRGGWTFSEREQSVLG